MVVSMTEIKHTHLFTNAVCAPTTNVVMILKFLSVTQVMMLPYSDKTNGQTHRHVGTDECYVAIISAGASCSPLFLPFHRP